jgi:predicted nucleotidyltransferase
MKIDPWTNYKLSEILADWVEPSPGVPAVYLFGSRVRYRCLHA